MVTNITCRGHRSSLYRLTDSGSSRERLRSNLVVRYWVNIPLVGTVSWYCCRVINLRWFGTFSLVCNFTLYSSLILFFFCHNYTRSEYLGTSDLLMGRWCRLCWSSNQDHYSVALVLYTSSVRSLEVVYVIAARPTFAYNWLVSANIFRCTNLFSSF